MRSVHFSFHGLNTNIAAVISGANAVFIGEISLSISGCGSRTGVIPDLITSQPDIIVYPAADNATALPDSLHIGAKLSRLEAFLCTSACSIFLSPGGSNSCLLIWVGVSGCESVLSGAFIYIEGTHFIEYTGGTMGFFIPRGVYGYNRAALTGYVTVGAGLIAFTKKRTEEIADTIAGDFVGINARRASGIAGCQMNGKVYLIGSVAIV
jgi:hypothetical protein